MKEAVPLAVKVEEGAESPGYGASRSWKRPETIFCWSLAKDQPCPHLSLVPCWTSDIQNYEIILWVFGSFFVF